MIGVHKVATAQMEQRGKSSQALLDRLADQSCSFCWCYSFGALPVVEQLPQLLHGSDTSSCERVSLKGNAFPHFVGEQTTIESWLR